MGGPRIALVTHSTKPRGGFVHTLGVAEALHRDGVDVVLHTARDPEFHPAEYVDTDYEDEYPHARRGDHRLPPHLLGEEHRPRHHEHGHSRVEVEDQVQ